MCPLADPTDSFVLVWPVWETTSMEKGGLDGCRKKVAQPPPVCFMC